MSEPKIASLEWCTPHELGRRWGISVNTVYRQLHERTSPDDPVPAGKIPAIRVGNQLRVNVAAVEAHERAGKPQPATTAEIKQAIRGRRRAALSAPVTNHLGDL